MNKNTSTPPSGEPGSRSTGNERIGEILRQARELRGIGVETLAKELKLNARYIQALEANDYDQLPGDTYIRVYLRSLCVYFSLNPEELLMRFFDERGVTGVDTLRKDSSTKINISAVDKKKGSRIAVPLVLLGITLLIAAFFIAGKQVWFGRPHPDNNLVESETDKSKTAASDDSLLASSEKELALPGIPPKKIKTAALSKKATIGSRTAVQKERDVRTAHLTGSRPEKLVIKDTVKQKPATVIADAGVAAQGTKMLQEKRTPDPVKKIKAVVATVKDSGATAAAGRKLKVDPLAQTSKQKPILKDSTQKKAPGAKKSGDTIVQKQGAATALSADSVVKRQDATVRKKVEKKTDTGAASTGLATQKKDTLERSTISTDTSKKAVPSDSFSSVKKMKLRIAVQGDSSWARVFYDGKQWRNLLKEGKSISFYAKDSFNVHFGANEAVSVTLNGKPVSIPGTGVISFKIDSSGTMSTWNSAKWNEVFQNRN
jgi:cytoskeletal protein RodZ